MRTFWKLAAWSCLAVIMLHLSLVVQPAPLQAQATVEASMVATPAEVTVGDVFTLTLQIIHPSDSRAIPAQLEDPWGGFEIRDIQAMDTVPLENSSGSISTQNIQATLWQTGTHTTPPLTAQVQDPNGSPTEVDVQPATVTVRSVLQTGDTELRDIRPQATLPFMPFWQQMLIAGLVGFLILAGLVWWWLRRRQPVATVEEQVDEFVDLRPADVKALESIAQIADQHLPTQRRFAEHYDKLTDVLRRYLKDGFDIPALDMTTAELKSGFPTNLLAPHERDLFFGLLEEADWVKFAKVEPDFASADQLPERARQFVLATAKRLASTQEREQVIQEPPTVNFDANPTNNPAISAGQSDHGDRAERTEEGA